MEQNRAKLIDIVDDFACKRVAVIGDLMLDIYLNGKVTRISPEAPVPIVSVTKTSSCLGGAGNVMRNIATLGGIAHAYGMIGDDKEGQELCAKLQEYQIDSSFISVDPNRKTTQKTRVLAGGQQLLRIDHEEVLDAPENIRKEIVDYLILLIRNNQVDAIIFEDYGKGLLSTEMVQVIVNEATKYSVLTSLDPKPGNLNPVQGITIIKPNRKEAFEMVGRQEPSGNTAAEELDAVAKLLLDQWKPQYLLISLAAEGMALFSANGDKAVISTTAREVFDVSGAGDTVVAALTLALTAGATPQEAASIGNYAAGVVVSKIGTVTVSKKELKTVLKD